MFEDDVGAVAVFDFDELANHLLEQGVESSPAEVHGCLTGLLCCGAPASAEFGLNGLEQTLALNAHGELASQVMQLYGATALALEDDEYSFHPLLPDDECAVAERTEALAGWCRAFLAGIAHGNATLGDAAPEFSSEGREILGDIAAMVEAEIDDEDPEDELEESYMEIVEYLRFATLNLALERREPQEASPAPTLH